MTQKEKFIQIFEQLTEENQDIINECIQKQKSLEPQRKQIHKMIDDIREERLLSMIYTFIKYLK